MECNSTLNQDFKPLERFLLMHTTSKPTKIKMEFRGFTVFVQLCFHIVQISFFSQIAQSLMISNDYCHDKILLFGGLEHFLICCSIQLRIIIPIDVRIFQRGRLNHQPDPHTKIHHGSTTVLWPLKSLVMIIQRSYS